MQIVQVPTSNGIHDIKIIAENDLERAFVKQLAEAGTLSSLSRAVANSVVFRPISVIDGSSGSGHYTSRLNMGKFDIEVVQNQNRMVDLKFKVGTTPLDLTQYTSGIVLQVFNQSKTVIFTLNLDSGLTVTGEDNNVLSISMTPAQTKLLCHDTYYYDVLFRKPTSNIYYVGGKIIVQHTGSR